MHLKSPIFGDVIKINKACRLQSSEVGLQELKAIEMQIKDQRSLPDFGYGSDNYLLDNKAGNKWQAILDLISETQKSEYLVKRIKEHTLLREVAEIKNKQILKEKRERAL